MSAELLQKSGIFLVGLIAIFACKQESQTNQSQQQEPLKLYEMSDMALFMEEMHHEHQILRKLIKEENIPDSLPFDIKKIYNAEFTDNAENDAQYQQWASVFEQHENAIIKDPENAQKHYNNAIKACISCHQIKCTGPIPRIKKLLLPKVKNGAL